MACGIPLVWSANRNRNGILVNRILFNGIPFNGILFNGIPFNRIPFLFVSVKKIFESSVSIRLR